MMTILTSSIFNYSYKSNAIEKQEQAVNAREMLKKNTTMFRIRKNDTKINSIFWKKSESARRKKNNFI